MDRDAISAAREAVRDGRFEQAAAIAAQMLRGDLDNLDALEIKALAEMETGDEAAAERTLRHAIAVAPERRWPYGDLARLLLKLRRAAEAEAVARSALSADSDNGDAHAILASLLGERGLWVEAAAHFELAIASAGPHPQLLTGLGQVRLRQGRLQDARGPLEKAAAADPNAIEPLVYLAEIDERLGRFGAAMQMLDRADRIAGATGRDVALQRSVLLARMGKVEDALALLDGRDDLSGAALLQRGRLRDRVGRYAESWSDWATGKAAIAEATGRHYPRAEVEAQADALAEFFTPERIGKLPRAARRGDVPQPIFIVGFPRSGTTLVEQILASHSAIRAGGELPFGGDLGELVESGSLPAGLSGLDLDGVAQLRDFYLRRAEEYRLLGPGADWFTDKMPSNAMWLPLLRLAFPQSPVVLLRRHPLDVLTSVMSHDMTHGFNCGYRLEDAAAHLAMTDRLLDGHRLAGIGPTHELRYESLVADQEGETGRVMAAIGLPLEPAQLRFHDRPSVSPTPSYAQVAQPLNDRSIGRWRNYATELEPVVPIVSEAMERGGYAA